MVLNLSPLANHLNESLCSLRFATKVSSCVLFSRPTCSTMPPVRSTTRRLALRRSRPVPQAQRNVVRVYRLFISFISCTLDSPTDYETAGACVTFNAIHVPVSAMRTMYMCVQL